MDRETSVKWFHGFACGLLVLGATGAFADIDIEDRTREGRAERFSLTVRDEPINKVMDKLSERFNFEVDGYPAHWSKDPMSFSATGDLERVLRSLLKDTSHVFEYHTDLDTKKTRIASLKLLNEGVEGFVANQPPRNSPAATNAAGRGKGRGNNGRPNYGDQRQGELQFRDPDIASSTVTSTATDAPAASNASPNNLGGSASRKVSGLSQTLEARARQSGTPANTEAATGGSATSTATGVSEADMQALTQKALQDVKGLAEALRKAEGK